MSHKIHEGRNVKRFREMLQIKQEAMAGLLGDDWNQKKISLLEQKETIEPAILEQVAKVLKISPEVLKNLSEEHIFNFVNNFNDNSVNHGPLNNHHCTFDPLDKIVELHEEKIALYERMLKEKEEMMARLEKLLGKGK